MKVFVRVHTTINLHICVPLPSFTRLQVSGLWKVKMNEEHSNAERPPTVPEGTIALAV